MSLLLIQDKAGQNRGFACLLLFFCLCLLFTSCPEPTTPPEVSECPPGQLPCENDSTQCCDVICDKGYHLCGEDSTDCCLDTTSHNFVWEIDTLESDGSYLNDVAIINKNNIWVVGNIVTDSMEYNAAHWDGSEWELLGIYSNTLNLYSIQYFSEDDIWVTSHCFPLHWNGEVWSLYHLQNMGLDVCAGDAIWGSSPTDIYFVGVEGSIVHYDGSGFTQIESPTDLDLYDIWGIDTENIWIVGQNQNYSCVVLGKNVDQWNIIYENIGECNLNPYSIYTDNTDTLYLGGSENVALDLSNNEIVDIGYPEFWVSLSIRGNNRNDRFYTGDHGEVVHYNGQSWMKYQELLNESNRWRSIAIQNDLVIIVGHIYHPTDSEAIVAFGRRN